MNKYQEALDNLSSIAEWTQNMNSIREYVSKLQELVNKETPIKPLIKRNTHGHLMWGTCDVCKSEDPIWFGQRCSNDTCGQKIDWSDEE